MKQDLQSYIEGLLRGVMDEAQYNERALTNASVTLRKRFRDVDNDDRTGIFNPESGNWVAPQVSNLYSWNLVKPTVRANESAMITANVRIQVEPRFAKDTTTQMGSNVAEAILEQQDRLQWTIELEEYLAQEQQLGAGVFVRTYWDADAEKYTNDELWDEQEQSIPGKATCPQCGTETEVEEDVETIACPECEFTAEVLEAPTTEMMPVMSVEQRKVGEPRTEAHPFFNFRVDSLRTAGGKLANARWFEHHYLQSEDTLEAEYDVIPGNTFWSYPVRWQWALETGNTYPVDMPQRNVDRWREVRDIYLTPEMYCNFESQSDYILKKKGEDVFHLGIGKTLDQAEYKGSTVKNPVWCFRTLAGEILDIFPCDFREEWSYMTFLANPSSFWGTNYSELISLQDIVNYMLTLQVYHIRRNAITSIVYNKGVFNPDDFEEDLIPTKETFPHDFPIQNQFAVVPALTMSGEPMQMFNTIVAGVSSVSQVTPALQGQSQPNEPYHAQLLQRQQSLGLLAPAELSKARVKMAWAVRQLKMAQENWTREDTDLYLKLNPEWTEDDIHAFLDMDIKNDLIVSFVEGSEIPRSLIERELELRQLVTDIQALSAIQPGVIGPDVLLAVLSQLAQSSNIELDVNNMESAEHLAQVRYEKLRVLVEGEEVPVEFAEEAAQEMMGQPIIQLLMRPNMQENHAVQIEFYSDKMTDESSKDEPNYFLIACLKIMCQWHDEATVQMQQRQVQMQMAAQAPMMAQQQQMMAQQQEADAQAKEQETADKEKDIAARQEAEDRNRQLDRDSAAREKQADRDHDMAKHLISEANSQIPPHK